MKAVQQLSKGIFAGAILAGTAIALPALGIRYTDRHIHLAYQAWLAIIFLITVWIFIESYLSVCLPEHERIASLSHLRKVLAGEEFVRKTCIWCIVFLYTACCALCGRVSVGVISGRPLFCHIFQDLGVLLIVIGALWVIRAIFPPASFNGMIPKYYLYLGYRRSLIVLAGLAMAFGSWLPLCALPGMRVASRWWFNSK